LVFEGEIWAMLAEANTCCIDWATPEFRGPTAPTAVLSPVIAVALDWPVAGWALSSKAFSLKVTPGTVLFLLASSTAIWAPYWMPRPVVEFSPDSGASTPMVSVLPPPSLLSPPLSSREPQAVSVRAPVARTEVSITKERRTISPFRSHVRPGGAAGAALVPNSRWSGDWP
jgi:hypothetical protein